MKADSLESVSNPQVFTNNNKQTGKSKIDNPVKKITSLKKEREYTEEELKENVKDSVKNVNEIVERINESLSFQIHEATDKMMVKVIDNNTDEIIKELPPEEMLDLEARIHEMVGLLIDKTV